MLNRASLIGHVGRDPEVRHTQNGEIVASFTLATTEKWKDKASGEKRDATEWHRVVVFGKLAEIVQSWVKKGTLVYVGGKIVTRKYIDKDGQEKASTEIRCDDLKLLGGKTDDAKPAKQASKGDAGHFADMDDDVPF